MAFFYTRKKNPARWTWKPKEQPMAFFSSMDFPFQAKQCSGQIALIPKPKLRAFWGPPFGGDQPAGTGRYNLAKNFHLRLVGGFNPFHKYARQIGSFHIISQNRDENNTCFEPTNQIQISDPHLGLFATCGIIFPPWKVWTFNFWIWTFPSTTCSSWRLPATSQVIGRRPSSVIGLGGFQSKHGGHFRTYGHLNTIYG